MKELIVIKPKNTDITKHDRLEKILAASLEERRYKSIEFAEELMLSDLRGKRLLFAVALGDSGINLEYFAMLKVMRTNRSLFHGCTAGLIVDGNSELFTKSVARELIFSANAAGCVFPGKPLVEGTRSLENFNIIARNLDTDNLSAYTESAKQLVEKLMGFEQKAIEKPSILAVHASNRKTSNTMMLWSRVTEHIKAADSSIEIKEISIRNGELSDCMGCKYETCLHFGEKGSCFYGGVITEQVYPALLECNALVMICPNYNDAVSANIAAMINRLTALFRVSDFSAKRLFAIVVSGYSGGDLVAGQLISALNINKNFMLPKYFSMIETANDPGSILATENIEERAIQFADNIITSLKLS